MLCFPASFSRYFQQNPACTPRSLTHLPQMKDANSVIRGENGRVYNPQKSLISMAKKKQSPSSPILKAVAEGFKKNALDFFNRMIHEKVKKLEKLTVEVLLGLLFLGCFTSSRHSSFLNEFAGVSFLGIFTGWSALVWNGVHFYFLIKHN